MLETAFGLQQTNNARRFARQGAVAEAGTAPALLPVLLADHGQQVVYTPGRQTATACPPPALGGLRLNAEGVADLPVDHDIPLDQDGIHGWSGPA